MFTVADNINYCRRTTSATTFSYMLSATLDTATGRKFDLLLDRLLLSFIIGLMIDMLHSSGTTAECVLFYYFFIVFVFTSGTGRYGTNSHGHAPRTQPQCQCSSILILNHVA